MRFIRKNGRIIPIRESKLDEVREGAALPAGALVGLATAQAGHMAKPKLLEHHLKFAKAEALMRYRANLRNEGAAEMTAEAARIAGRGAVSAAAKLRLSADAMEKSAQRGYKWVRKLNQASFRSLGAARVAGGLALPLMAGLAAFAIIAPKGPIEPSLTDKQRIKRLR